MGTTNALGWAEAAETIGLDTAIFAHLRTNLFPPLPGEYVTPIIEALEAVRAEDYDRPIKLDKSLVPKPNRAWTREPEGQTYVAAEELVRVTRTEAFL